MKLKWKLLVDLAMSVLLLVQMAYMWIGETAHEWAGAAMCVLFILHHVLNWKWHKNLLKGNYTQMRIAQTAVDFLVLLSMIGLIVSGVLMSRTVFAFLHVKGNIAFARILHMLAAYWGFLFMSLHLGLHWGMIMSRIRKGIGKDAASQIRTWILRGLAMGICILGIYAFCKHNIASYLFLKSQFVFFDTQQPLIQFFAEYVSMAGLLICLGHYGGRLLHKSKTGGSN